MAPITMTYELAMGASKDAANQSMGAAGRSKWSRQDYSVAVETFERLWPLEADLRSQGEMA